jgi:hypothetical protein
MTDQEIMHRLAIEVATLIKVYESMKALYYMTSQFIHDSNQHEGKIEHCHHALCIGALRAISDLDHAVDKRNAA